MARLGWAEEVFYRRLHSVVDDYGRYFADVGLLRAACYPRQLNKVSDSDIGKWLQCIADAGLVRVYPAQDGERYLEVLDFGQQVRAKKSRFPDVPSGCVADAKQTLRIVEASAPVFVSVSVCEDVSEVSAVAPSATPTPPAAFDGENSKGISDKALVPLAAHFALPEEWGVDAEALGWAPAGVLREAEKFRQYWVSGKGAGKRKSLRGWRQAWSNWLGKAAERAA